MSIQKNNTATFFVLNSDLDTVIYQLTKLVKKKISYKIIPNEKTKDYTQIEVTAPPSVHFEVGKPISTCENSPCGIAIVTAENKYLFTYHN